MKLAAKLGKIIPERRERAVGIFHQVFRLKPVPEQGDRGGGRAGIALGAPRVDLLPNLGDERRHELVGCGGPLGFVGWKPALLWNQRCVRRGRKVWMQCHLKIAARVTKRESIAKAGVLWMQRFAAWETSFTCQR